MDILEKRKLKREYAKQYREKNRQLLRDKSKKYASEHKEQISKYKKEHQIKNKEKLRQKAEQYYCNNKEYIDKKNKDNYRIFIKQRRDTNKLYRLNNPERIETNKLCYYAVSTSKIVKQPCIICHNTKAEGHHFDYTRPLDVMWLCRKHHKQTHNGVNLFEGLNG